MTKSPNECIIEILSKLETDDLKALASTVSQGLLKKKIITREGAVDAIIAYSPDRISILHRKIITKEILFSYLHDKKIPVSLPITKNELIYKITSTWKSPDNSHNQTYFDVYKNETSTETSSHCTPQLQMESMQRGNNQEIAAASPNTNMYIMAQQFSQWFYSMMNQNIPISTEHFYPDACLKLNVFSNGQCTSQIVENSPEEISLLLFNKKIEYNLYFNPNLSQEGSQFRMDPHGLVLILTCGTLHVNNACAGVFEQTFALARDPFADNNWKIKKTQLNLRSQQDTMSVPTLCDSELTNNYLALPDG